MKMKLSVLSSAIILAVGFVGGRASAAEPKPVDRVAELEKKNQAEVDKVIDSLKNYGGSIWAADELGKLRDPWAVEPLLTLLVDSSSDVRKSAARALGRINDRRAIQPLIAALGDGSSDVRWAAHEALGMSGAPAVEGLIAALEHGKAEVRAGAVAALGKINDARGVGPADRGPQGQRLRCAPKRDSGTR